ncbi:MAG TPA: flagellar motor protein MotB [Luteitalea sp.]|nr:flagellar motor protein MotB [Luteitalea sp.]
MRRDRRRRHQASHASHERWLVSYADFITLLFAFFTTMYAISTVDARKLSTMVDSMQTAFDSQGVPRPAPAATSAPATVSPMTTEQRERALAERLRERLAGRAVDIDIDPRGIVVSMREAGSFQTGSADLSPVARDVLSELSATLGADTSMKLRVEGHTDDVPIQTGRFASNWELSTARATSVVTYLVQQVGLAPSRLSAAGYGEFHPRVANTSDVERARNRRVDIVILNEETAAAEEPASAAQVPSAATPRQAPAPVPVSSGAPTRQAAQ